jgi:hypothetical protein
MYDVIYVNPASEKVSFMCETMEEVLNIAKTYPIHLVLDEANNIITGEVLRTLESLNKANDHAKEEA